MWVVYIGRGISIRQSPFMFTCYRLPDKRNIQVAGQDAGLGWGARLVSQGTASGSAYSTLRGWSSEQGRGLTTEKVGTEWTVEGQTGKVVEI